MHQNCSICCIDNVAFHLYITSMFNDTMHLVGNARCWCVSWRTDTKQHTQYVSESLHKKCPTLMQIKLYFIRVHIFVSMHSAPFDQRSSKWHKKVKSAYSFADTCLYICNKATCLNPILIKSVRHFGVIGEIYQHSKIFDTLSTCHQNLQLSHCSNWLLSVVMLQYPILDTLTLK